MMDAVDPVTLRAEHDMLMSKLSTRLSTERLAQAAIGCFVGLILAGAGGKLFWDLGEEQMVWALAAAIVGCSLIAFAFVQYVRGRLALTGERTEFARLSALRRSLGIDDPAGMIPQ